MELQDFFNGMSKVASSVHVVTTDGPAGKGGITVSAMSSVTAEPPTLLICVHRESPSCALIKANQRFCVNLLQEEHAAISDAFGGRTEFDEIDTLSKDPWQSSPQGSIQHKESLVSFDCEVTQYMQVGSHDVIFGAIKHIETRDGRPLLYADRAYQSLK